MYLVALIAIIVHFCVYNATKITLKTYRIRKMLKVVNSVGIV